MARTKKYLSSKSNKLGNGFYRPIKRAQKTGKQFSSVSFRSSIEEPSHAMEDELTRQLEEVKQLKAKLEEKINLQDSYTPHAVPNKSKALSEEDFKIDLFGNDNEPEPQEFAHQSAYEDHYSEVDENETDEIDFSTHSENEEVDFLKRQLLAKKQSERESKKELEKIKEEYAREKRAIERKLDISKKDLFRQQPITHNKFFSLSKELGSVVDQMNKLVQSTDFPENSDTANSVSSTPLSTSDSAPTLTSIVPTSEIAITKPSLSSVPGQDTVKASPPIAPQPADTNSILPTPNPALAQMSKTPQVQPADTAEKKKIKGLPKIVMIMGATFTIVTILIGIVWLSVNRQTEVSTQLLEEYLPAESQAKASQQDLEKKIDEIVDQNLNSEATPTAQPKAQVKGSSDEKYAESQADVSFAQTFWETISDPSLGIKIDHPKNTVNFIKTESSITFIRKNGYIFKIQMIESALELPEYWKMIKAGSLNYKVKETTFRELPALFLELEDITDYPGDKYFVKKGDFIYEIWYATYSPSLSDDDAKRIDIMLNSFNFLE